MRRLGFLPVLAGVIVLAASSPTAQQALTLEWIYSDAGRAVATVPHRAWLTDGSLLLLDEARPEADRRRERLAPGNGARTPAFDMGKALDSLRQAVPGGARATLGWPQAIDDSGARLFYALDGDVFALDTATSKVSRLTHGPEEERNVTVSPDGRSVAFVRGHDLFTLDLASGHETALTHDGSDTTLNGTLSWMYWEEIFGRRDLAYWWSPDGRRIAYLQTDESHVTLSHFVDFEPATPRLLTQRYPTAGTTNPIVRVGIVEASGGPTTWVGIEDAPFEYVLRVGWLPDASRVSVQTLTRDQRQLGLYFADAKTGAARRVLTETDPAWVNVSDDLRFIQSGREFLWSSERPGYRHLYRYAADGRLLNPVTSGDWALT